MSILIKHLPIVKAVWEHKDSKEEVVIRGLSFNAYLDENERFDVEFYNSSNTLDRMEFSDFLREYQAKRENQVYLDEEWVDERGNVVFLTGIEGGLAFVSLGDRCQMAIPKDEFQAKYKKVVSKDAMDLLLDDAFED